MDRSLPPCASLPDVTTELRDEDLATGMVDFYLVKDDMCAEKPHAEDVGSRRILREAKTLCSTCPRMMRLECLFMGLERLDDNAVYGGYTKRERRKIVRERDRRAAAAPLRGTTPAALEPPLYERSQTRAQLQAQA